MILGPIGEFQKFLLFLVTDKQWDLSNFKYLGWNMVIAEIFVWEYKIETK